MKENAARFKDLGSFQLNCIIAVFSFFLFLLLKNIIKIDKLWGKKHSFSFVGKFKIKAFIILNFLDIEEKILNRFYEIFFFLQYCFQDVTQRVQAELDDKKLSKDFDTVMGLVVG